MPIQCQTEEGTISVYQASGDLLLSAVNQGQLDFVKGKFEELFEEAFEKKQSDKKIEMLLECMAEENWTCKQAVDAVKYFLKYKITYYDKWIIPDIMAFPAGKCFTRTKMHKLCTDGGRVYSEFIRFKGADGEIYFWDKNFGKCPFPEEKLVTDKWVVIDNEKLNETKNWNSKWGNIPEGWIIREDNGEAPKPRDIENLVSGAFAIPENQTAKIHSINEDLYRELKRKGIYPESETPEELKNALKKVIVGNKTYFIAVTNPDEPVEKILGKFIEDFRNAREVI